MDLRSRPKILYIDDTPSARALVMRVLASDYTVIEASEPLKGIELAIDTQPDLVLIDINLPNLSGRETAARLKTILPNTVLVAFSADVSPGARERALAAGCAGYLTKPLDVDIFGDQISEFLRGKRESAPDQAHYREAFEAELVERLETKVRELTKTAERNAFLNEQNIALVNDLKRNQRLLEGAARIGQIITSILDLDELLQTTIDVICGEYNFSYAAIFLIDTRGEWAELHAGYGEAGALLRAQNHKLAIGGKSMIGTAISQRQARLVQDIVEEEVHFKNPYLPNTRSEMALPLIFKDTILGALSVQSDQLNAFQAEDVTALQTLANQVAIAINNARLLRDLTQAHHDLLRSKTFEAIATTTGETIHWVGNKATPIPNSVRRVREDISSLVAAFNALLAAAAQSPGSLSQHPLWPLFSSTLTAARHSGYDLEALAQKLACLPDRQLLMGGLESILEDLEIIEQSATSILDIKEDLIGPVRLATVVEIDLVSLLNRTIFEMGLPDEVIEKQFADNLPLIRADARQLGQVYNNLIKNAWEALHGTLDPQITVTACLPENGRYIQTEVTDNGPGIPPEMLDKIWISFFTTKGNRGGTGLGLSACIAIVNQLEGKISVSSKVGAGTTFTVLLPVNTGS